MNEIKFRYICKSSEGLITNHILTLEQIEHGQTFLNECFKFSWEIVSRDIFIGLKDVKGCEIYEGDILQWCNTTHIKNKWEVKATNGGWNPFIDDMTTDKPYRYEVIGNIYDNAELLKEN